MKKSDIKTTTIYIKNMVCNRCIQVVNYELTSLGLKIKKISLGEVQLFNSIPPEVLEKLKTRLHLNGFELIEDKKAKLINQIKGIIINSIYNDGNKSADGLNYSELIEQKLKVDYHYLSSLFSSLESITIEHYIILQKIERVKELLKYGELTLSEIAYKLDYSSVQHLSAQFKKVTGFSASEFKKLTENFRKPLDKIY
jgi:AraC-like DNA-binding protein